MRSRAETLLEVILAVSILTLLIVPAAGAYVNSLQTRQLSRNSLIAETIAVSGIEMTGNFIATNSLRFSAKGSECWNTKPDFTISLADCDKAANKIGFENLGVLVFRLMEDPDTLQWSLDSGVSMNVASNLENYRLRQDPSTGFNFLPPLSWPTPVTRGELTNFYRQILIQYAAGASGVSGMDVTSFVQYSAGAGMRSMKRSRFFPKPT